MKLVSINIEGNKHLERVLPFVTHESPDVLCLQEVLESDLDTFIGLGYTCTFLPMTITSSGKLLGIALCTRGEAHSVETHYYRDPVAGLQIFNRDDKAHTVKNGVIFRTYVFENETYTVGTTHFTWTPEGATPNDEQIADMGAFLAYIKTKEPHVICGDFNIPRNQNPLYQELIEHYTDTIPESYTSSLDATLHRHGASSEKTQMFESFMVDYVFTKPPYTARDARLEFGISDHAAVVATISKN